MRNYIENPEFKDFLLEESYLLGVTSDVGQVSFHVLLALATSHPMSADIRPGERFAYRYGDIAFSGVERIEWRRRNFVPTEDVDGEIDYGNIELFEYDGSNYHLSGQWGDVLIVSPLVAVTIMPD